MNKLFHESTNISFPPSKQLLNKASSTNNLSRNESRSGTLLDFPVEQFRVYTSRHLDEIPQLKNLPEEQRFAMRVVASVLPFRVNRYVIENLINWNDVPEDPVFQLTFPQPGMLSPDNFEQVARLLKRDSPKNEMATTIANIRRELNPHPAGQQELNVPTMGNQEVEGVQHKYPEVVLFFPSQGQTCHSYCTFCFRWAQFVGDKELKFASSEAKTLHNYLAAHPNVTDLLVTGGDPMVMKAWDLAYYLDPLVTDPRLAHIRTIRIGTKSLTFWPQRFVTDKDADNLLRLFEYLVNSGKRVALMAHYNHWREMETEIAREAIRRVRDTGVTIHSQGPVLAHINDDAATWVQTWQTQINLGIVPYYMFVERDTGARRYFELPLVKAWETYRDAVKMISGLGRTVRGPSMSTEPGKVEIQGVAEVQGEKVFVLRFIQGRNPEWVQRPFFAKFDDKATWLDQLQPAFSGEKFFFEDEFCAIAT